jgi:hypothetical protein
VHRHARVPAGYGLHANRLTDPGCELADLPPIGLVVLSHFHWETIEVTHGEVSVQVTATPRKHGPRLVDFALLHVIGSLIQMEDRRNGFRTSLHIAGDTLVLEDLHQISKRSRGSTWHFCTWCVKPAKTYRRFGGSRTRKTGEAVQPKRLKPYSGFG